MPAPKEELQRRVDARRDALVELSHRVHRANEIRFEERLSSEMGTGARQGGGVDGERGVCGLEAAFVANAGTGPRRIGRVFEYAAPPGIGHACGHNVMA